MTPQIAHALKTLGDALQEEAHEHCIAVNVFFNSEGYEIDYRLRAPESLRADGISMRNLRGEWIKKPTP